jgi:flavin reductase (DIM6/NTAB) family NADH-FMN oxidoreductase RutF
MPRRPEIFVCSLATYELREAMNRTSAPVAPDVDEMQLVGLTPAPSRLVAPPRVKESPVAFECRYWRTIELPGRNGKPGMNAIVLGQVIGIHIADEAIAIARLGYGDYAVGDEVFALARPKSRAL